jgi:hypothetical protein
MDPMFGEVAEGCGVTLFSRKEVLVNAEDSWTGIILHLRKLMLKKIPVTAFDGRLAYLKLRGEGFLANAVPVFFENLLSECFSGSFVGKDTRKAIIEVFATGLTEIFASSEVKDDFSGAKTFMADPAVEGIFDS